ncbi:hypothetical protein GQ457_04G005370 [Hibiscus cannabinus]
MATWVRKPPAVYIIFQINPVLNGLPFFYNGVEICDLLATCGSKVSEVEQIATILNGLPVEYEAIIAVLTASREPYSLEAATDVLVDAEARMMDPMRTLVGINYTQQSAADTAAVSVALGGEVSLQGPPDNCTSVDSSTPAHDGGNVAGSSLHMQSSRDSPLQQENHPVPSQHLPSSMESTSASSAVAPDLCEEVPVVSSTADIACDLSGSMGYINQSFGTGLNSLISIDHYSEPTFCF